MSTGLLDINDHGEVYIACKPVSSKWRDLAARLGVLENTLATIEADYRVYGVERCMSAVIDKWLRRPMGEVSDDGVLPTWRSLCVALSPIDRVLAEVIAVKHGCNCISPAVSEIASHSVVTPVFLTESCGCNKCSIKEWRSKRKCQNKICHDNRPKMLLANPYHPMVAELVLFERSYDRQIRLCVETDRIAESFKIVSSDTWKHLMLFDEAKISEIIFDFGIWLTNSPFLDSGMRGLSSVCHDLRVSWFNFSPLHYLAEQYLFPLYPDVESNWSNYCAVFKEYCSNRHLADYTDVFFKVENRNIFLLEIDERYYNFTLADVDSLRKSLSIALDVPAVSLHLVTVKTGSVIIYFYYCYSDYLTRFMSLSSQQLKMIAIIKPHKVLSLTDLYHQFEYDEIQSYYYYKDSSSSTSTELQLWKKQAIVKDIDLSKKEAENQLLKDQLEKTKDLAKVEVMELRDTISNKEDQLQKYHLKATAEIMEMKDTISKKEAIIQQLMIQHTEQETLDREWKDKEIQQTSEVTDKKQPQYKVSEIASHSDVTPVFLTESCGCNKCSIKEWRSGRKCQNKICHDNRPKMLLANPYHPMVAELILFERSYDRQIRLCVETDRIARSFKIVSSDTWNHLNLFDEAKISQIRFDFGIWLRNSPFLDSGMRGLSYVCHDLRVSWFNFSPLHYLAEQYLFPLYPDVKSNWSNYCAVFKEYCSNRHLADYTDVFFKDENRNLFLLEIDERYYDFTLSDVDSFRKSLSIALDVQAVSLHLVTVKVS